MEMNEKTGCDCGIGYLQVEQQKECPDHRLANSSVILHLANEVCHQHLLRMVLKINSKWKMTVMTFHRSRE